MSSQRSNSTTKPSKPPNNNTQTTTTTPSKTNSLSSHLAMIELKQRILTSLSKLSDRDTHSIALEDFSQIIQSLSNDGVSMLLNCLYHAISTDPKPAVKKESIRLLSTLCTAHTDAALSHLTKIIENVVKKLKDSDSGVRDACKDAIGTLSGLYLKGGEGVVSLFAKPLFEVMGDTNKTVQGAAAGCLARVVECAGEGSGNGFMKMCGRVVKYLNGPNFMAKAQMLQVVSSLAQVGAIAPQSLEPMLQSIHELLGNSDWAIRKAAADALIALSKSSISSIITPEGATSTLDALEACKFDKIKPVRESMTEALHRWKKIAGKGDGSSEENKASSHDGEASESSDTQDKKDSVNDPSNGLSPTDSKCRDKRNNIYDKAVGILKKKALTDQEPNPEFFHKLETRSSVEVIVPRRFANPNNSQNEEELESNDIDPAARTRTRGSIVRGAINERCDSNQRESSAFQSDTSRNPGQSEGFMNNKGNWMAVQRQLLQLERQQTHLMHMLQDFMGGSHDSMITLENRVRGLERVVEDMARDLSLSSGRRGNGSSSSMVGNKFNGFPDYSSGKIGRVNDGRINFGERYSDFNGIGSGMKNWDFQAYGKNGQIGSSRRGWEKGAGPVRFGEGPSARSVWQASKDEATLEAIRVAGEDNGTARTARVAIPERIAEAEGVDGAAPERDPAWNSWSNAMDALQVGDIDSAFAEVLSTGDDFLLVKLMDKSGPVIDQLSNEVAFEVLHAVSQFIMEQDLFETCLYWVQQLSDIIMENGPDVLRMPMDLKKEILLNLNDASSSIDLPEDWEGSAPDSLILQLASAWDIDLQNFGK